MVHQRNWQIVKNPYPSGFFDSLMHHDPSDFGLICLVLNCKIHFLNSRIHSSIFSKICTLNNSLTYASCLGVTFDSLHYFGSPKQERIERRSHYENSWAVSCSSGGGQVTPLYGLYRLYRYVRPQRVWFFSHFGHNIGYRL